MRENGHQVIEISRFLEISESTCRSVLKVFNHRRGSVKRARRTGRPSQESTRGEASLLQKVRKCRVYILKDITTDFNNGNQGELISELTVKRILHNNTIYRRAVRKRIVMK